MAKKTKATKAVEELNETLGLDPQIDPKLPKEELDVKISEAVTLITEDDEFTSATTKFLEAYMEAESEDFEDDSDEDAEDNSDEDFEDDSDENAEDNSDEDAEDSASQLIAEVEATTKRSQLRHLVTEHDELEPLRDRLSKLRSFKALKKAVLDHLNPEPEDDGEDEAPAEKKTAKKAAAKKPKKEKKPSPYGTAVELMCKEPELSKDELTKKLTEVGIDTSTKSATNAISTGRAAVKKIYTLLKENGHIA